MTWPLVTVLMLVAFGGGLLGGIWWEVDRVRAQEEAEKRRKMFSDLELIKLEVDHMRKKLPSRVNDLANDIVIFHSRLADLESGKKVKNARG